MVVNGHGRRYQDIIATIRRDVATSVGQLLWKPADRPTHERPALTEAPHAAFRLLSSSLPEPWRGRLVDLFGDQGRSCRAYRNRPRSATVPDWAIRAFLQSLQGHS